MYVGEKQRKTLLVMSTGTDSVVMGNTDYLDYTHTHTQCTAHIHTRAGTHPH